MYKHTRGSNITVAMRITPSWTVQISEHLRIQGNKLLVQLQATGGFLSKYLAASYANFIGASFSLLASPVWNPPYCTSQAVLMKMQCTLAVAHKLSNLSEDAMHPFVTQGALLVSSLPFLLVLSCSGHTGQESPWQMGWTAGGQHKQHTRANSAAGHSVHAHPLACVYWAECAYTSSCLPHARNATALQLMVTAHLRHPSYNDANVASYVQLRRVSLIALSSISTWARVEEGMQRMNLDAGTRLTALPPDCLAHIFKFCQ
eukprot:801690-Pelagomonas_calceolata.AAC.8